MSSTLLEAVKRSSLRGAEYTSDAKGFRIRVYKFPVAPYLNPDEWRVFTYRRVPLGQFGDGKGPVYLCESDFYAQTQEKMIAIVRDYEVSTMDDEWIPVELNA